MKFLMLSFFILVSCESTQTFQAPKVSNSREQIFIDDELPARIKDIRSQTGNDNIAELPNDAVKTVEQSLNLKLECNETEELATPTADDIAENHEEVREYQKETEPEYFKLAKDDKIRHNFKKLGGSSEAIEQALCFFNKHKDSTFSKKSGGKYQGSTSIKNEKYMVVQDFTIPSTQKRFFLINLEDDPANGKKAGDIDIMYSSHGGGSEKCGYNNQKDAVLFSNQKGCNLTARGFMVTGERAPSSLGWKWHMKFDGIQKDINDNNRDRLVVFHQGISSKGDFLLTNPGRASSLEDSPKLYETYDNGKPKDTWDWGQNRTFGCTAVSPDYAEEVYEKTKGGALYYNFTQYEKEQGPKYCGSDLLLK